MSSSKKLLQAAAGSASGGAGGLNVEDVFSTYLYEGNGSSQIIENGVQNLGDYPSDDVFLHLKGTTTTDNGPLGLTVNTIGNATTSSTQTKFTSSSLYVDGTGAGDLTTCFDIQEGQIKLGRKDFTIEYWVYHNAHNSYADFGSWNYYVNGYDGNFGGGIGGSGTQLRIFKYDGQSNSAFVTASVSTSLSTWYHVAITRQDGTAYLFLDGVLKGSGAFDHDLKDSEIGGITIGKLGSYEQVNAYFSDFRITVGKARYTSNFTVPTAALPTDTLTTGEGGLVWTKQRSGSEWHTLGDTERGTTQYIFTNATNANVARSDGITSFNSDGYSLSNWVAHNESGEDYASWTFRKAPKFFDVVTYTGDGTSSQQIAHNLGVTPGLIIVKAVSSVGSNPNWLVWHRSFPTSAGYLNDTIAFGGGEYGYSFNAPSDTYIDVRKNVLASGTNDSGITYVAYLFAHNDGDGEFGPDGDADIIKCGSFTGTGAAGNEITLGFEPQWLLVKRIDTSQEWYIFDVMRGLIVDGPNYSPDSNLIANAADAENSSFPFFSPTATGFVSKGGNANNSGGTFVYIAIRRGPMAVPTDATDVFDIAFDGALDTNKPYIRSDLNYVDMAINSSRTGTTYHRVGSRLTQGTYIDTNSSSAETTSSYYQYDFQNGWFDLAASNSINTNGISWMWKRAPSYFDVVAYTGTGSTRTVSHNLGVAPEMMWVKNRNDAYGWMVYVSSLGATYKMNLDTAGAATTSFAPWNSTEPTATEFTLSSSAAVNQSGSGHIAYLFASLDGISKCGSYTGNSTGTNATDTQNIECGFAPRFVFVKATSTTGQWAVWDTTRGIISGDDPTLYLDSSVAEDTYDFIDPYATGFTITNLYGNYNNNGVNYIFYAVA